MKRLLPVIIALCIIGATIVCLPKVSENNEQITSLEQLADKKVGVQTGVNYDLILKDRFPNSTPVLFSSFAAMIPSVQQGKIDAYLTETISFGIEKKENPDLEALEEPLAHTDCYVGVTTIGNGPIILDQFNEFLTKIKANGTYDKLLDYWVTNYDPDTCTVDKSGITGENGVLMCTAEASYEPFCMTGEGGELLGYDVDMIYRFCREYGYTPQIDPMEFDAMPAALASGKYTLATGLLADEERAEEILFTDSYTEYDIIAAVHRQDVSFDFIDNIKNSFYKTFIKESRWQMFVNGVKTTIIITIFSVLFGSILGLLLYLWCFHGKKAEQKITNIICWFMGSTPTVVLLMVLYYVIFSNILITNVIVSIIGFTLIFGCNVYSLIVSGVKAVGNGQMEAAYAQGFSPNQAFFKIILPQAIEHFLPAYKGDVISLIQDTSVVGYIAVTDLTKMSDLVRGRTYDSFFPLLVTAGIYFLIIWLVTSLINMISLKITTKSRKPEKVLKGLK